MDEEYKLSIYNDRYDEEYKGQLAELLTIKSLLENAEIINEKDPLSKMFDRRVSIKFCGLSSLSLLGGIEGKNDLSQSVTNFLSLVSNKNSIVEKLNRARVVVDIKIMFAYPYCDFMYDLIQAEETQQDGLSINCILRNNKVNADFGVPKKMRYEDITRSITYQHLLHSLNRLQDSVIEGRDVFNHKTTSNKVIVKFTPINILTCLLIINNKLFIDPYLYSKQKPNSDHLILNAPISEISIPCLPSSDEAKNLPPSDKNILDHFCSIIGHFGYLWQHPYTMYSTDATEYHKWRKGTLSMIKHPSDISYLGKAMRLKGSTSKQGEIDLWKQYCKNGLLKYCSKFLEKSNIDHNQAELTEISSIPPIKIFIIGAWQRSGKKTSPSDYMKSIEGFIFKYFAGNDPGGLKLQPVLVRTENGQHLQKSLFLDLNSSQLGVVIITPDNTDGSPKPNVSLERGYLMGRLGSRIGRSTENKKKELVFTFNQDNSKDGSDISHIGYTSFSDQMDFELQFYKFIKWLWDITELDSQYAIRILDELKRDKLIGNANMNEHLIEIDDFIRAIRNWEDEYLKRMEQFKGNYPSK